MGVDISSIGTYNHWSPIADYTTTTLAKLSDQLPVPTGRTLVTKASYYTGGINPILITESNDLNSKLEVLL